MKILHVGTSDIQGGGSGIASYRLHTALLKTGVESRMLVRTKGTSDPFVSEISSPQVQGLWSKAFSGRLAVRARGWIGTQLTKLLGMEGCSLNIFPTGLHKVLNASGADIIHLHWPHAEMISIWEIAKINKPLVWTLHDCWPFLGAEHHSSTSYWALASGPQKSLPTTSNQQPATRVKLHNAVNHWIFKKKQKAWAKLNIQFVAPGNWMAQQVRQSRLFADAPVTVIPDGLNLEIFQPLEQLKCRQHFNLPLDKKLILFGAHNPSDPNKGSDLLQQALLALPKNDCEGVELVVFGAAGSHDISGLKTHWMGVISSEKEMAALYNTADVVCVPSRRESFGQIASEAMACGVPVVVFRTSGLMDVVDHKKNGYLAEPFDTGCFCKGIEWIFSKPLGSSCQPLSIACRAKAEAEFSSDLAARKYISVYEDVKFNVFHENL